ncbi:MAG TPA: TolC family protein [Chitinophagales bacterium]|nr:TolC family protein [Chitinophagales bacterium]
MKKNLLFNVLLLLTLFAQAQQPIKLSLNEAIDYAIKNQPAFQNYKVDQQIASAKQLESTSKYLPKLSGNVDFRDNLKLGQIALKFPNPITGIEEQRTIQQGTQYSATAGVDLTVPVLDMASVTDMKYTKQQKALTALQVEQATVDLKLNVSRAYYLALLNTERVKKAEKSVERFQKAYDDTKVRYDNQNAVKSDLNRAYLNLSNAKYQLKISQDSIKTSKLTLGQILGLPLDAQVELTDVLPVDTKAEALPEYPDIKSAELSRVELRAENMNQTLSTLQLKKINMQYVPSLNGYGYIGGQGLDNTNLFSKDKWFWSSYIGLRLAIPIFDGLQKVSLANQQKLVIQKSVNNISTIRNNINYQLQSSLINYANASTNLQLIKDNVTLAEDVVKDVNVRYANGVATYQEVVDAETTLKETEFNYLQSLYVFLVSELEWKKANGKL